MLIRSLIINCIFNDDPLVKTAGKFLSDDIKILTSKLKYLLESDRLLKFS